MTAVGAEMNGGTLVEIDRPGLLALGPAVFRHLHEGKIFHVRGLDEIFSLVERVERHLHATAGPAIAENVRGFLRQGQPLTEAAGAALVVLLRELRDTRFVSCLFSDLVAGFGLPANILLDAGFFRCVFHQLQQALWQRMERGELPEDIFRAENVAEPEPFLQGGHRGGCPHRDVDAPHYTFQFNFWFPLHDIPAENCVLIFPEVYTQAIPYQQPPADLSQPDSWGYGPALKRAMALGDTLIFHSQHFHASPTQAPQLDRLTAELRVASGCIDDNANIYRRQFWSLANFAPVKPSTPQARAERLHPPRLDRPDESLTAHELFASLFAAPRDARVAGNLWSNAEAVAGAHRLAPTEWLDRMDRLRRAPFAEDRQLAVVRLLQVHGRRDLATLILKDTLARTTSYYFALEIARLASEQGAYHVAEPALMRAASLAEAAPVQIGAYRGDIPARENWPPLQLMPAEAHDAALRLATVLRDFVAAQGMRPAPMLDHRLFFPHYRSFHRCGDHAVVFVRSLYVFVPRERLAEVGLRHAPEVEGGVAGDIDAEKVARDPAGVFVSYSNWELFREILSRGIIAPGTTAPEGGLVPQREGMQASAGN